MKTKSIAILTMGLAMLSMDGMAQTTRQEYKDILDIQLTPGHALVFGFNPAGRNGRKSCRSK